MINNDFSNILSQRRSIREYSDKPISLNSLNRLIWAAQGKREDAGLRTVPSAHGLHPLRLFVMAANVDGLNSGLYAVDTSNADLELIQPIDLRADLQNAAIDDQPWIGNAAAVLSVCADFVTPCRDFADQPPFGQRGSRYVYIEAGAAAQNVQLQAAAEGIASVLVAGFNDEMTAAVLGLETPVAPVLHLCLGSPLSND